MIEEYIKYSGCVYSLWSRCPLSPPKFGHGVLAPHLIRLSICFLLFFGRIFYSKKTPLQSQSMKIGPKIWVKFANFHTPSVSCIKTLRRGENEKVAIFWEKKKSRISPYLDVAKVAIILLVVEGPTVSYIFIFGSPLFSKSSTTRK